MLLRRNERTWNKSRMRLLQLYKVIKIQTHLTKWCSLSLLFHQPYPVHPRQTSTSWRMLYFCQSHLGAFMNVIIEKLDLSRFNSFAANFLTNLFSLCHIYFNRKGHKAKEKYRGIFETQKSGDKTGPGEIGLDIRTHASPKVGQDQVSGGVSVLCWHAAPVAYVLSKPCTIR